MRMFPVAIVALLSFFVFSAGAGAAEWALSTQLPVNFLDRISAADGNNVWTFERQLGMIYHFDGSIWSFQTALYAVQTGENRGGDAYSSSVAYAVGNRTSPSGCGRIYGFNGSSWTRQTETIDGSIYLYDAFVPDGSEAFVGGSAGNIYHTSNGGGDWTVSTTTSGPSTVLLLGIDGLDTNSVWAVGGMNPSFILYYDGDSWSVQSFVALENTTYYLRDVSAVSSNDVWASGDGYDIFHFDGSSWSLSTDLGGGNSSACISGSSADEVWAGCAGTKQGIFHYNGAEWTFQTNPGAIVSIDASVPGHVWAAGLLGKIYHLESTPLPTPIATPIATPTPGRCSVHTDFDGDGTSDIALFRETEGRWAIRDLTRIYFGSPLDTAVPADYDGDGVCDIATFRGNGGMWAVRDLTRIYLGMLNDYSVPGDYDGDGAADFCVFRPENGLWSVRNVTRFYFGGSGDRPAVGYYDGDDLLDVAVYKGGEGLWAVRGITRFYFGSSADNPVPGDYAGDGTWQGAIFRPADKLWSIRGLTRLYFGSGVASARPADYDGDGRDDIGVYRFDGLWAAYEVTRAYFGSSTDNPVTR